MGTKCKVNLKKEMKSRAVGGLFEKCCFDDFLIRIVFNNESFIFCKVLFEEGNK